METSAVFVFMGLAFLRQNQIECSSLRGGTTKQSFIQEFFPLKITSCSRQASWAEKVFSQRRFFYVRELKKRFFDYAQDDRKKKWRFRNCRIPII